MMKNYILFLLFLFSFTACKNDKPISLTKLQGETMATYYKVSYRDSLQRNFQREIDSLLITINKEVNTYDSTSTISIFNKSIKDSLDLENNVFSGNSKEATNNQHFISNILAAKQVWEESNGFFDPTVMPLVNYWGFGYTPKRAIEQVDSVKIDSLLDFVGFDKISFTRGETAMLKKALPNVQIDFSACAKGYAVDAIGRWLSMQNISDYYVEIGGESIGFGNGSSGNGWIVAIGTPKVGAELTDAESIIRLTDGAIATSGNYRNFYDVKGEKYAHSINPKTGFPQANTLLSASIFTDECMMSDAYATACMIMRPDSAKAFIERLPGVEGLFIVSDEQGNMNSIYTEGVKKMFVKEK